MKRLGKDSSNGRWVIRYDEVIRRIDLPRLAQPVARRIKQDIEKKLTINPAAYGRPLRGVLRRCWKLRVGDWRVIYFISGNGVRIFAIGHRREIYNLAQRRWGL